MAQVQLICGAHRSGRCAYMDRVFLDSGGRALLLTPTQAYAQYRRESLFLSGRARGAWGEPVRPFTAFVQALLEKEQGLLRQLDDFERGLLLEHCLAQAPAELGLDAIGERPGLIQHLLRVINSLKQAAVEPDHFQQRLGRAEPMDRLVAAAYRTYQDALVAHGLYDLPGLYWEADLICRKRKPALLAGVDSLLLDGFDDFTPSELRLLQGLRPYVDRMVFGLNYDNQPDRRDVYSSPAETCQQIQTLFDAQLITMEAAAPTSYSEFAADKLFWRDPPDPPGALREDLTIAPALDSEHELEAIARRIKTLLVDQEAPPESIAIVYRNLGDCAPALESVLQSYAIPIGRSVNQPLLHSMPGAGLVHLFEAMGEWRREAVLEVLGNPLFQDLLEVPSALAPHLSFLARTASVIGGEQEWSKALANLQQRVARGEGRAMKTLLRRLPEAETLITDLLAVLDRLGSLVAPFSGQAGQRDYAEAVGRLLERLRETNRIPEAFQSTEEAAFSAIHQVLEALAESDWNGEAMPWEDWRRRFERGLRSAVYVPGGATQGVAILDAATARNLRYAYVFFGGLIEGVTPAPPSTSAIYSQEDLLRLKANGIVLEDHSRHSARERLLFHHVLSMAQEHLFLYWPMQKGQKSESRRSPYLGELLELFPEDKIEFPHPTSDQVAPSAEEIFSLRDLRNSALYQYPDLCQAFAKVLEPVLRGAALEKQRYSKTPFDAYEGVLAQPALKDGFAQRFDASHQFSVNQLEEYLACPFRFFSNRILECQAYESPEEAFDPRVRGLLLHSVLENFHRHYADIATEDLPLEEAQTVLRHCLEEVFSGKAWRSLTAPDGLVHAEQRHMEQRLLRYLKIEADRKESGWRPWAFEVGFGDTHQSNVGPLDKQAPFVLETETGPLRFGGRIDRIDRSGSDTESLSLRLVDYKSSQLPGAGEITRGLSLQMTIYAWAVEAHVAPGSRCELAHFIAVGRKKWQEALGLATKSRGWPQRSANAQASIVRAVQGMRAGYYPPDPEEGACAYCDYRQTCRYEKNRIALKRAASEKDAD